MSMPKLDDPFSNASINQALQSVPDQPSNEIEGGVTYDQTNGLQAEAIGSKDVGDGWTLNFDATFSERAKFAGKVLIGRKW